MYGKPTWSKANWVKLCCVVVESGSTMLSNTLVESIVDWEIVVAIHSE